MIKNYYIDGIDLHGVDECTGGLVVATDRMAGATVTLCTYVKTSSRAARWPFCFHVESATPFYSLPPIKGYRRYNGVYTSTSESYGADAAQATARFVRSYLNAAFKAAARAC